MKINILLIIIFVSGMHFSYESNAQDFRDKFTGQYNCQVFDCHITPPFGQYSCADSRAMLRILKHSDSTKIEIRVNANLNNSYLLWKEDDSTFINDNFHYRIARFYAEDSVEFTVIHSSVGNTTYIGKRDFNSNVNHVLKTMNVFPNPFDDCIHLKFSSDVKRNIILTNVHGRILIKNRFNSLEMTIPTTELPHGVYMLQIVGNGSRKIVKLIKTP